MSTRRSFISNVALPLGLFPSMTTSAIATDVVATDNCCEKLTKPEVIFFDVNETLLDLEPLKRSISKILNNNNELGTLWFTSMLHYSLVVTTSNQYFDFGAIGAAALQMIAQNNNIKLSEADAKNAIKPLLSLKPHKEVVEALSLLKQHKYRLVTLTNSSNMGIMTQMKNSALAPFFEENITIEDFGKFKRDTDVYHWAARKMKTKNSDCLLVAAHGWDVAGATWAGWQSAFLARKGQQLFPLAPSPDYNHPDLLQLANILIKL